MNFKSWMENFEQWNGRWIHYSHGVPRSPDRGAEKVPLMKIHYNMVWNDPMGIYFFPEKFENKTQGGWHNYDFKYIVEFPSSMKVFDLSKFTDDEFDEILNKYNIAPEAKEAYKQLNLKPSNRFWTSLEHHFAARQGQNESGRKAKMNRFFRDMGYDAIFDDTDAIFTGEHQLILLNPQVKYKVIDVVRKQGTGWNEVQQVLDVMKKICQPYGKVKISKPERKYSGWDSGFVIKSRVSVNEDNYREGPYIAFELYTSGTKKGKPEEIRVSLSGATPRLPEFFNSSISSRVKIRDMDMTEMEKMILDCLQKVWQSHSKAA